MNADALVIGHKTKNREDDASGEHRGGAVEARDHQAIPVNQLSNPRQSIKQFMSIY